MVTIGSMFNNINDVNNVPVQNNGINFMSQLKQCQQNPGTIIDILAQANKITPDQYQELQQYKNNPQQIAQYLINNGYGNQINQLIQMVSNQFGGR